MKCLVSAFLAGAMALSLAACGGAASTSTAASASASASGSAAASQTAGSDLDYIKGKGKLVIGYTVYEPMNYTDADGNFTGFDTELATAVCEKLGVEPEFVEINWDTKVVELDAKSIDCIWNGMTLTDDIMQNTATTKAYAKNAQVVVVKDGTDYTSTADLVGKTVVAEAGSAGEAAIEGDENLAQADYVSKSVQTDCLMEVAAGTADAAVLDLTLANMQAGDAVVGAIHRVARHRMVDGSHVNADLVGTARFQAALQHRELAQPFQHLVAGIGVLCVGLTGRIDRHLLAVGLAAAQVALHKTLILGKAAIDDGIVGPLHAVHCHLLGKADVGCIILCHHQQAAGVLIDAVDNTPSVSIKR